MTNVEMERRIAELERQVEWLNNAIAHRTEIARVRYAHYKSIIKALIEVVKEIAARSGRERGAFDKFESDKIKIDYKFESEIWGADMEFHDKYPDDD
jgi:hypothetical protein